MGLIVGHELCFNTSLTRALHYHRELHRSSVKVSWGKKMQLAKLEGKNLVRKKVKGVANRVLHVVHKINRSNNVWHHFASCFLKKLTGMSKTGNWKKHLFCIISCFLWVFSFLVTVPVMSPQKSFPLCLVLMGCRVMNRFWKNIMFLARVQLSFRIFFNKWAAFLCRQVHAGKPTQTVPDPGNVSNLISIHIITA